VGGRRRADRVREFLRLVGEDAEVGHFGAEAREHRRQKPTVGVVESGLGARRARLDNLIAGREQGNAHPPSHTERRNANRRGERQMLRARRRPAGSAIAPVRTSSPARRRLAPRLKPGGTITSSVLATDILLHEDGVGAGRHRRAGENADRRLRPERMRGGMSGEHVVDNTQVCLGFGDKIRMAHGVTIDRRVVEWRQIEAPRSRFARGTRPAASARATVSVSVTGSTRAISRSASLQRHQRTGKTQSSRRRVAPLRDLLLHHHPVERHRVGQQDVSDRLGVVERNHRHRRLRHLAVGCDRDDVRIVRSQAAAYRRRPGKFRAWDAPRACSPRRRRDRPG